MGFSHKNFYNKLLGTNARSDDKITCSWRGSAEKFDRTRLRSQSRESGVISRRILISFSYLVSSRREDVWRRVFIDFGTEIAFHVGEVSAGVRLVTAIHPVEGRIGRHSGHHPRPDYDSSEYGLCGTGWTDSAGITARSSFIPCSFQLRL